jgi:basic membrane protein A
MKRFVVILTAMLVMTVLVLTGCQKKEEAQMPAEDTVSIGMVTDVGGVNDNSFNQSAWEGLQRVGSELGAEISYLESGQGSDYGPNMETMYDAGTDLIWAIGFLMGDAVYEAAVSNPDTNYAIIDFAWGDTPKNLVGVVFKAQEPSFLVGYIAGKMTKTGTVGFVGGIAGNIIDGFDYGFHAGVAYANPDVKVLRQYADSFTDAAIGKSIANQMYLEGADIIFSAAGLVGDGVIEAAKEQNLWAIGVDKDQSFLAPDNVLTSAMKRVDQAVFSVSKSLIDGEFGGGSTLLFSLENGGVGIAPTSDKHVPANILAEVAEVEKKIISGDVEVPFDAASFAAAGY